MARRRRKSDLDKLLKGLAKLPWPVCLALAVVAYAGLALLANRPVTKPANLSDMSSVVIGSWLHVAGTVGQYLVPILLCIAAVMSFAAKRRRDVLLRESQSPDGGATIKNMRWQDFEQLTRAWLESHNYRVTETAEGADGGVDLVAKRDGDTTLVQCKQWRANKIGVSVVRELYGLIAAQGATSGLVISIGEFTPAAHEFAAGRNIELADAQKIIRNRDTNFSPMAFDSDSALLHTEVPNCPRCDSKMVRRVAKKGANTGNAFFGCERYPDCRGTRSV